MSNFELDPRLANDCFVLGEMEGSLLLLMNNKLVPWFVLVPKVEAISELYELDEGRRNILFDEINVLSEFIKDNFDVDKLNVAAIGNLVKQLHVHVVARTENDYCWPGVVWGVEARQSYSEQEVAKLRTLLETELKNSYKRWE
jgi:diadenosine tetraphosphate (Ap4A) HIT family hydrolase